MALIVISPHCDDAVFGCSGLLVRHPGAVVLTIFAGRPRVYDHLTPWDEAAGFRVGDDVVAARRAEDRAALTILSARPVWLDFLDSQYGTSPTVTEVAEAIERALGAAGADTATFPLGLFHPDHELAHESALAVARRRPELQWLVYEDAIYRRIAGLVDDRLDRLQREGFRLSPIDADDRGESKGRMDARDLSELKRRVVACYPSQLRALSAPGSVGYDDVFQPERLCRLMR
jgi:LmbE family N-acetylglucosaminyl deacetylase